MEEAIKCEVLVSHCREVNGELFMFEPMFSGVLDLPNDNDTKECIEKGWLKIIQ